MIDLHTHSLVSDGTDSPARVVELAAEAGCSAVALTDHDSLAGLGEARARADELGVRLVPGCEVSCVPLGDGGLHVLVYFVDDPASPLGEELDRLRADRVARNARLVERLSALHLPVAYEDVVRRAGSEAGVGRLHFALAMVGAGHVESVQDAFDRYLGNGRPAYVSKARLTAVDVVALARRSGGAAVMAHPLSCGLEWDALSGEVECLAAQGLAGLECTYGRYPPEERDRLGDLARRFGLVATGGSDYHGANKPDLAVGTGTGDLEVPDRVLEDLGARCAAG